mmetsp:Transcript_8764/g.20673  ORF Transcript_8764/g.20673 Transcript_8764/m.20673 type:complete len:208 (-) Transcript_8764:124-747(-)
MGADSRGPEFDTVLAARREHVAVGGQGVDGGGVPVQHRSRCHAARSVRVDIPQLDASLSRRREQEPREGQERVDVSVVGPRQRRGRLGTTFTVPALDAAVLAPREHAPIHHGKRRDTIDVRRFQRPERLPCGQLVGANTTVSPPAVHGRPRCVGGEGEGGYPPVVGADGAEDAAETRVPQLERSIGTTGDDHVAVRRHTRHLVTVVC